VLEQSVSASLNEASYREQSLIVQWIVYKDKLNASQKANKDLGEIAV
jgi:hypothetical protein